MEYLPHKAPQIPGCAGSSYQIKNTVTEPRQQSPGEKTLRTHSCASSFTGTKRSTHCACLSDIHNYFQEPFRDILKTLAIWFHGNNFQWCVEPNEALLHWHRHPILLYCFRYCISLFGVRVCLYTLWTDALWDLHPILQGQCLQPSEPAGGTSSK